MLEVLYFFHSFGLVLVRPLGKIVLIAHPILAKLEQWHPLSYQLRCSISRTLITQADPFWLYAEQAPKDSTKLVELTEGQILENIIITGGL